MHRIKVQSVVVFALLVSLVHAGAAGPIGVALANGSFQVDRSEVLGNASIFEGAEIQTGLASSRLRLTAGPRLELGSASLARVYAGRTVLERGAAQLERAPGYPLEARGLRVAAPADSIARVQMDGPGAVLVSAIKGPVRVTTKSGVLLARLNPGGNFRFQPQAAAADAFELSGCLLKKGGQFVIVDQTTTQMMELRGSDLAAQLGNRVSIKGVTAPGATPRAEGAAQVVQVQSLTRVAPGGCLATAASVAADPLPGTSVSQSLPEATKHGANKAVIAGVLVAGGAAAGVAVALGGKSKSP